MSFPASIMSLDEALRLSRSNATSLKNECIGIRTQSLAGDVPRTRITAFLILLNAAISVWQNAALLPGIGAYAQAQFSNAGLDIVVEFNTMVAAATSLRDWVFTNFPKDAGSTAWLVGTYDAAGNFTSLVFTTAQLTQLRTNLAALEATIA